MSEKMHLQFLITALPWMASKYQSTIALLNIDLLELCSPIETEKLWSYLLPDRFILHEPGDSLFVINHRTACTTQTVPCVLSVGHSYCSKDVALNSFCTCLFTHGGICFTISSFKTAGILAHCPLNRIPPWKYSRANLFMQLVPCSMFSLTIWSILILV